MNGHKLHACDWLVVALDVKICYLAHLMVEIVLNRHMLHVQHVTLKLAFVGRQVDPSTRVVNNVQVVSDVLQEAVLQVEGRRAAAVVAFDLDVPQNAG